MSASVFFNSSNELATVTNTFKVNGTPTDPGAATLTVTSPTNVVTAYTGGQLTHTPGTGLYSVDITCNEAGTWTGQWDGTTTASDTEVVTWEVFETQLGRLYCTVEALKSRLSITNTNSDFELHAACFAASRSIESYCDRFFWRTSASEVRTFEPADWYCLELGAFNDLVSVASLKTGTGGTFGTTWLTSDYQLWPQNPGAAPETRPYTRIKAVGSQTFPATYTSGVRSDTVQITGVFGWPAVPMAIKQAALILAADTFKLKDAPFGMAGEGEFAIRVGDNRRAMAFAAPYRRHVVLMA